MRSHSYGLILAILVVVLTACGTAAPAGPDAGTAAPQAAANPPAERATPTMQAPPTAAPTATAVPVEPGTSRSAPLPLGTEIRFEAWAVTISSVAHGDEAAQAITSTNPFNDPAPEGWQYLLATLTVTNISSDQEAQSVLFGTDVRVTGERNVLYPRAMVVVPQPLEGELFPEGSAEGQVAFLMPADEGNLMFYVTESFSFDAEARRFVAVDAGAAEPSARLFAAVHVRRIIALISDTLVAELVGAPGQVQELLTRTLAAGCERLVLSAEALALRDAYLTANVVTARYADDALHVAQATLARCDVIVSWNFKHLVNLSQGYGMVVIVTPAEAVKILESTNGDETTAA